MIIYNFKVPIMIIKRVFEIHNEWYAVIDLESTSDFKRFLA
jgi:hypothetical protein